MPKGKLVNQALKKLRQFDRGHTVQPGMFSTLDEAVKDAPFDANTVDQWRKYLQPGRMVKREGVQFPLKKEELDWSLNRLKFDDPSQKFTKEQLRDLVSDTRRQFGVTMGEERLQVDPVDGLETGQIEYDNPIPSWWAEDGRQLGAEVKAESPKYGSDYAGDTDSRLFHSSPGSIYEESATRMPGLDYRSHFDQDTLSWSRTSTHNVENPSYQPSSGQTNRYNTVRLVEEIQSDLHSDAATKIYVGPGGGVYSQNHYDAYKRAAHDFNPDEWTAVRAGHASPEAEANLRELNAKYSDELEESIQLRRQAFDLGDESKKPAYLESMQKLKKMDGLRQAHMEAVPDAPYKNPKDYAGLELRKQLLNAVDNDDDYLALVRGKDQIARYRQGMDEKSSAGMELMYDKIYPSELKKLAKRYGATVEDVEVPVSAGGDMRPPTMSELGMESVNDLGDNVLWQAEAEAPNVSYMRDNFRDYMEDFEFIADKMRDNVSTIDIDGDPEAFVKARNKLNRGFELMEENIKDQSSDAFKEGSKVFREGHNRFSHLYEGYEMFWGSTRGSQPKTFPAIKLTDEVKERVKQLGVPQFQEGGIVRQKEVPQRGGLSAFSMLRRPDAQMSEPEFKEVFSKLSESDDERRLQEKMGTGRYWWDTVKHLPAMFLARMKKVNPETGEVRWLGRAPIPDLDMVARGMMTMDEWKAEKAAAEEYNAAGENFNSTWIDDTKAMAALPAMLGNLAGEYIPGMPGSLDPSSPEAFGYPEFSVEASGRVGAAERSAQEDFGIGDPEGLPQHLMGALGAMGTQVPVPGGQLRSAVAPVTKKIAGAIPDVVRAATAAPRKMLGAASEFANPFVDPSLKNYAIGTGFGGALDTVMEPSSEQIRDLEDEQRKFDRMSEKVEITAREHWEDTPMEVRLMIMSSPFAMKALENLSEEQRLEMIDVLDEMGAFDDAEQE